MRRRSARVLVSPLRGHTEPHTSYARLTRAREQQGPGADREGAGAVPGAVRALRHRAPVASIRTARTGRAADGVTVLGEPGSVMSISTERPRAAAWPTLAIRIEASKTDVAVVTATRLLKNPSLRIVARN